MERILLIEDEDSLAVGLVDVLSLKGYDVHRESRGDLGLKMALAESFDLILLDGELPGLSGFEILKSLREAKRETRVLMLTARKTEMDRVLGFELGADDYVTKPFSLAELLGRIKAILRRNSSPAKSEASAPLEVSFGDVVVDLDRFTIRKEKAELNLPARAFEILRCLVESEGQVLSRDTLTDSVWGPEEAITLRTLNNLVVKIRQVIEPNPEQPQYLKTVHGVGYRLDVCR